MTSEDNIKCTGTATVTGPTTATGYELGDMLGDIRRALVLGCGSRTCRVQTPTVFATDGPCTCDPKQLAARLHWIADALAPDDGCREKPPEPLRM